ncbi:hypothetical protein [Vibrio campbellii]|nr:hypothetical protein [Vibrio parahaemolyticus]
MSLGENSFADELGLVQNKQRVPSHWKDLDSDGHGGHWVIPDFVMIDHDGNRCLIEYKHGNKLNTDGARGGKKAADKKKADYLNNPWGNAASRRRNAEAHYGWNHSLYKMVGMKQHYDRVIVVDPRLNQHATCAKYQKNVINKGRTNGVEFMTKLEFESAFDGCLDVGVDRILDETVSETSVTQLRTNS